MAHYLLTGRSMMKKETEQGHHQGNVSEKGGPLQEEPPAGPSGDLPEDIVTVGEDSSMRFTGPDEPPVGEGV